MNERRFTLERVNGVPAQTDDLIEDLRRVAAVVGSIVSQDAYSKHGRFAASTVSSAFRHLGSRP